MMGVMGLVFYGSDTGTPFCGSFCDATKNIFYLWILWWSSRRSIDIQSYTTQNAIATHSSVISHADDDPSSSIF